MQKVNTFKINHQIFFERDELGTVITDADGNVKVTKHHLQVNIDMRYGSELAKELSDLFPLLLKIKQYVEENYEASANSHDGGTSRDSQVPRGYRGEHFSAGENH